MDESTLLLAAMLLGLQQRQAPAPARAPVPTPTAVVDPHARTHRIHVLFENDGANLCYLNVLLRTMVANLRSFAPVRGTMTATAYRELFVGSQPYSLLWETAAASDVTISPRLSARELQLGLHFEAKGERHAFGSTEDVANAFTDLVNALHADAVEEPKATSDMTDNGHENAACSGSGAGSMPSPPPTAVSSSTMASVASLPPTSPTPVNAPTEYSCCAAHQSFGIGYTTHRRCIVCHHTSRGHAATQQAYLTVNATSIQEAINALGSHTILHARNRPDTLTHVFGEMFATLELDYGAADANSLIHHAPGCRVATYIDELKLQQHQSVDNVAAPDGSESSVASTDSMTDSAIGSNTTGTSASTTTTTASGASVTPTSAAGDQATSPSPRTTTADVAGRFNEIITSTFTNARSLMDVVVLPTRLPPTLVVNVEYANDSPPKAIISNLLNLLHDTLDARDIFGLETPLPVCPQGPTATAAGVAATVSSPTAASSAGAGGGGGAAAATAATAATSPTATSTGSSTSPLKPTVSLFASSAASPACPRQDGPCDCMEPETCLKYMMTTPVYRLTAIILHSGVHYVGFYYDSDLKQWYFYDDAKSPIVVNTFQQVKECITRGVVVDRSADAFGLDAASLLFGGDLGFGLGTETKGIRQFASILKPRMFVYERADECKPWRQRMVELIDSIPVPEVDRTLETMERLFRGRLGRRHPTMYTKTELAQLQAAIEEKEKKKTALAATNTTSTGGSVSIGGGGGARAGIGAAGAGAGAAATASGSASGAILPMDPASYDAFAYVLPHFDQLAATDPGKLPLEVRSWRFKWANSVIQSTIANKPLAVEYFDTAGWQRITDPEDETWYVFLAKTINQEATFRQMDAATFALMLARVHLVKLIKAAYDRAIDQARAYGYDGETRTRFVNQRIQNDAGVVEARRKFVEGSWDCRY